MLLVSGIESSDWNAVRKYCKEFEPNLYKFVLKTISILEEILVKILGDLSTSSPEFSEDLVTHY